MIYLYPQYACVWVGVSQRRRKFRCLGSKSVLASFGLGWGWGLQIEVFGQTRISYIPASRGWILECFFTNIMCFDKV